MSDTSPAICAGCGQPGDLGTACPELACRRFGYHRIPASYFEASQGRAQPDPIVGQRFGDYIVVDTVGSGGFGKVYLALQLPVGMRVALKILRTDAGGELAPGELKERFFREAQALAELSHPNIVRLIVYGVHGDTPYLVTEYVSNAVTLREALRERENSGLGFSLREVRHILRQSLNALDAAHARGIVHRDVKPENIMLQVVSGDPHYVRMLDFGLAKFLGSTTITGMVLGTPTYIAPEQLKGDPSGPWTDLYATAVMAYRLLFGRSPFGESSADDIVNRKLAASFDPMAEVADRSLPSTVQAFFRRALAREPRDRYAGVAELRGGLEAALASLEAAQFVPMPARAQPSATLDRRAEPTSRRARQDRPAAVPETPPTQPARRIPALPGAPVVAADQQVELPNTTYPSQTGSMAATLVQRPQSAPAHRYPQSAGTAPRAPAIEAHSLEPVRRYRVFAWLLLLVVGIGGLAWILATSGLSFGRRPLQVTVNVGGAQISVGGEVLATSVAGEPVTVRLPMGADRIEIARSGYTSWVADLRDNVVESGQLLAKLSPEPSSGPDRVRVPGGPAWIGCLPGDDCQGEPPGSIAEVGTFDIDRTEVTVEAYQRCVKDGACKAPSGKLPEGCSLGRSGQAKHPMNCVTWEEARLYCAWAGKRLPSADEWEKAARGGCERQVDCDEGAARFPWGSAEPSCDLAVFDDGKSGAGCGARGSATPASRKGGESPDGAWDLAGNVAEWVDVWRAGKGSSVGGGVKGGGFTSFAKELAISTTLAAEPTLRAADLGFRCAVSP